MTDKTCAIRNFKFIIGQDSNAQIGIVDERCDEGERKDGNSGRFGIWIKNDQKGSQLIYFVRNNNLCVSSTFYKTNNNVAHKIFNKMETVNQIDHALIDSRLREQA